MSFIDQIKAKAKSAKKVIVLPESEDMRTLEAADAVLKEGIAKLVLLGKEDKIYEDAKKGGFDVTGATIIDPEKSDKLDAYVSSLVELRKSKGMTEDEARKILTTSNTYFGVMMIKMKDADGLVSGACHSTADTLRPSLQILKTKPGTKLVSSFFIVEVPNCEMGEKGTFVFSDCGLNQNPNAEELAAIAKSSAESFRTLVEAEPRVAMLSYSTMGSAKHDDVTKVQEATKIAKAEAYGPLTQGIAGPVNDLSRGCSASDIVGVVAITAVQAQM